MNQEAMKMMQEMFANPMFRAGFAEFNQRMQQEGLEAAKRFWGLSDYSKAFPYANDMYERLADFYAVLGFVPSAKYHEAMDENTQLKAENQMLKNMIKDVQLNLLAEGGEKAQQIFQDIIGNQIKVNTEAAQTFFEAMRKFNPGG